MKLHTFLLIATVFYGIFGLVALLVPAQFVAPQGLILDATGQLIGRTAGAALIGYAVICWFARSAETSPALRAILLGNIVYMILLIIVVVLGALSTGAIALLPSIVIDALALAGFAYYYFKG